MHRTEGKECFSPETARLWLAEPLRNCQSVLVLESAGEAASVPRRVLNLLGRMHESCHHVAKSASTPQQARTATSVTRRARQEPASDGQRSGAAERLSNPRRPAGSNDGWRMAGAGNDADNGDLGGVDAQDRRPTSSTLPRTRSQAPSTRASCPRFPPISYTRRRTAKGERRGT